MKANETKLLTFINKTFQFCIPIYQRHYSWTAEQCRKLYDDILRAGSEEEIKGHFIGSIVYISKGLSTQTIQQPLLVIDGQQRLTTCTLLLSALANLLDEEKLIPPEDEFSVKKIRYYYLTNDVEEGERHYKLLLSDTDRETLKSLVKNVPLPSDLSLRINENYTLFKHWLNEDKDELLAICRGLAKMMIVEVALESGIDNPQLIFESMNSTGLALSQTDLIRNYILMGLEPSLQTKLYQEYWKKIENNFGQEGYTRYFNEFMRHYLTVKNGMIPNINAVYEEFKIFSSKHFKDKPEKLVEDIYIYADYYCCLVLDLEKDQVLANALKRLKILKVDVVYPLLLQLYHEYRNRNLSHSDLLECIRLIESYVFRRAICGIPTNSLNKTFVSLGRDLDISQILNQLKYRFIIMQNYRIFPNDEEFKAKLIQRDVYNFPRRNYLLENLENYGRKETVSIINYTIEHILPQNPNLSIEWQNDLGENWQEIQKTYLHTLGNLTLTAYNSELSDKTYHEKRKEIRNKEGDYIGLAFSPLFLNGDFVHTEKWNVEEIEKRAIRLAKQAIKIWEYPKLDKDVLSGFKSQEEIYSKLNQYNMSHEIITLLSELNKEIHNLDENINEEYTKLYIGYNANKRFVDIVPLSNSLKITLNMPFEKINDSRNLCRDVSEIGKWGNGDIQFTISSIKDISYAISLIEQSLEWNNQN